MNVALILSGGVGSRLGYDIPKQYIEVGHKPLILYCIEQLSMHNGIDAIQIVADREWQESISEWLGMYDLAEKFRGYSVPGVNRQMSIFNGVKDIMSYAKESDCVLIHDAARPLLSKELISRCLESVKEHDGVLPVLPMKDTVYFSEDGQRVSALLNRSKVFAGQAPEAFVLGKYYDANMRLIPNDILEINGSTEPAVMAGMDIAMIVGDENNFKITTESDLNRFRKIVEE